ncbi:hypothetical protein FKM82_008556 [Ascaphus truei]
MFMARQNVFSVLFMYSGLYLLLGTSYDPSRRGKQSPNSVLDLGPCFAEECCNALQSILQDMFVIKVLIIFIHLPMQLTECTLKKKKSKFGNMPVIIFVIENQIIQ